MTTHVKTIWKIPLIPGRKVWMLTFMSMRLLFYQSIKYWKKSQADWFHCRCVFWPWRSKVFSASQDNSKYTAKIKKITFGCSGFTLCFKMLKWCKTMSHYRKQGKHNLHGSTRAHMKFTGSCTAPLLPLLPTAQHLTSRPQQDSAVTGSLTDIPCLAQKACIML